MLFIVKKNKLYFIYVESPHIEEVEVLKRQERKTRNKKIKKDRIVRDLVYQDFPITKLRISAPKTFTVSA